MTSQVYRPHILHTGEYLEINYPRRLIFTFCVPEYSKDSTPVTVDITPNAKGCELTLTHEGVWQEYESRTRDGWGMILDELAVQL